MRETDNLILFGKLNHRATDRHALALRYNYTDYSQVSDFVGEESRRFVKSHSTVGSVVSVVGESGVNELRVQYAYDDFDRRSHLPASALQAHFAIYNPSFGSFGKPWWLPVTNDERKIEIQERFSFVSGNHELRAGFSLSHDHLSEFFVGNADGNYDFDTLQDFAAGTPARAVILFGSMGTPTSWSPSRFSAPTSRTRGARTRVSRCRSAHAGTAPRTRARSSTCSPRGGASPTTSTTSRPEPGSSGRPTRGASSGPPAGSSTPARRRCFSPPPTPTPASTRATETPSCRRERRASCRWAPPSTTTARRAA